MSKYIRKGQYDVRIRMLTEKIVSGLHSNDYLSEYAAVLNWVRSNIRYTRDPRNIEQLKEAHVVLATRSADCDDMAILLGAMLGQIGAQLRLVAGAFGNGPKHPQTGERLLTHVWLEAYDPMSQAWVVLDPVPGRKTHEMINRLVHRVTKTVLA